MLKRGIVGAITGVISAVPPEYAQVGSGDLLSGTLGYDFAIADMGFRVAASPETPYQRETADYKKDQFDSAPFVGEQSLTGWWLRSQFSNHHGAGIKYYEVLDGETVLNRYRTATGLDPWTPGEVTLVDAFAVAEGASIVDAVPGTHSGANGVFEMTQPGAINHRTAAGAVTAITTGGTAVSITTDGTSLYAAIGNTIKVQDATTTLATLWTHHDVGATWQGVWWAKGRLFAVDDSDRWFSLSRVGGTTVAGDIFWSPGATSATWSLTETPAFVLLGAGTDIYAITLSGDGSVPTLAAPVVVAQVPIGETIASLHHYLGFVAICTQAGLRVGRTDTSDSTPVLVYGPTLIEGDFSASKRLASRGSLMFAVGEHEDYQPATLFAINLEQQVSELRPAWTAHSELGTSVSTRQGCVVDADGVIWAWSNNQIRHQDPSLDTSGTLVTGQLRLGTLEHKLFREVRVRAEGNGGTVGISSVLADGSTRFILAMDVSQQNEIDLTLSLPAPVESLGFQFTLEPDALDPSLRPTLLGYQVRALPAPERQRIIRVPLQLMDTERNRYGVDRGGKGGAWERLQKLEDLESRQVLVQFIDFRTEEAGVAQIDRVRAQVEVPSKGANDNFGGIAYIELRKIG